MPSRKFNPVATTCLDLSRQTDSKSFALMHDNFTMHYCAETTATGGTAAMRPIRAATWSSTPTLLLRNTGPPPWTAAREPRRGARERSVSTPPAGGPCKGRGRRGRARAAGARERSDFAGLQEVLRKNANVLDSPSGNPTFGSYPRSSFAREMSARESRTSPGRAGSNRGVTRFPARP